SGTFVPTGTTEPTAFCGTFRLPFSVVGGERVGPRRYERTYYLADDFKTLIPVHNAELSLGMATVRLELSFSGHCPKLSILADGALAAAGRLGSAGGGSFRRLFLI